MLFRYLGGPDLVSVGWLVGLLTVSKLRYGMVWYGYGYGYGIGESGR